MMSTMLWLVRKAAPSYLVFRGRFGFQSRRLESRKV